MAVAMPWAPDYVLKVEADVHARVIRHSLQSPPSPSIMLYTLCGNLTIKMLINITFTHL